MARDFFHHRGMHFTTVVQLTFKTIWQQWQMLEDYTEVV
jgi:hypothetical protein